MHKQYSMDTMVPDSTTNCSQDTRLQKFIGVDGVKDDVDGVSDTRDAKFGDLRVLEVLSEVPSCSSDETVAIMNWVDETFKWDWTLGNLRDKRETEKVSYCFRCGIQFDGVGG
ncbi:hypothetical protein V6N11_082885 [Hibiscus sabdariffa]|uniref:Uncharacterized protein n=1 Tax=Hibiscus sabdariffa TaxID=183260 RepID=A0ABR2QK82_9ROSI